MWGPHPSRAHAGWSHPDRAARCGRRSRPTNRRVAGCFSAGCAACLQGAPRSAAQESSRCTPAAAPCARRASSPSSPSPARPSHRGRSRRRLSAWCNPRPRAPQRRPAPRPHYQRAAVYDSVSPMRSPIPRYRHVDRRTRATVRQRLRHLAPGWAQSRQNCCGSQRHCPHGLLSVPTAIVPSRQYADRAQPAILAIHQRTTSTGLGQQSLWSNRR